METGCNPGGRRKGNAQVYGLEQANGTGKINKADFVLVRFLDQSQGVFEQNSGLLKYGFPGGKSPLVPSASRPPNPLAFY